MFCEDADDLNYWESVFVDETWVLRSDTYNLATGGYNRILSEESRRKMGDGVRRALKGRKLSEEHKRKLSEISKGRHPSEESKRKNREWHKGRHPSEETRQKLSEAHRREKAYWFRKHLPEEVRQKLSEALIGENHPNYGKHWYNNGKVNICAKECPEGFVPGLLRI